MHAAQAAPQTRSTGHKGTQPHSCSMQPDQPLQLQQRPLDMPTTKELCRLPYGMLCSAHLACPGPILHSEPWADQHCPLLLPAGLDTCLLHERPNKRGCCIHRSSGQLLGVRMLAAPTAEKLHTHRRSRVCNMGKATGPPRKTAPHPSQHQQPLGCFNFANCCHPNTTLTSSTTHMHEDVCVHLYKQPNKQGICIDQDRDCCCYY